MSTQKIMYRSISQHPLDHPIFLLSFSDTRKILFIISSLPLYFFFPSSTHTHLFINVKILCIYISIKRDSSRCDRVIFDRWAVFIFVKLTTPTYLHNVQIHEMISRKKKLVKKVEGK